MTNIRSSLLFALAIGGCASHPDAVKTPLIVNDVVRSAYSSYESTMQKKRAPIAFDSGEVATNCKQYLEQKEVFSVSENTDNFLAEQDYVICDTIKTIRDSAKNEVPVNTADDVSAALVNRLDLQSFRSSLFQRTDENQRTLSSVMQGEIATTPYSVQPAMEDWLFTIEVVALVDADNNGEQDWVVWITDKSGSGSYDTLRAYLAHNVGREGLIEFSAP